MATSILEHAAGAFAAAGEAERPMCGAADGAWFDVLEAILDELDYGVWLLLPSSQVRLANRAALRECSGGRHLRLAAGSLRAVDEPGQRALTAALLQADSGRRSLLVLGVGSESLPLATVPLGRSPNGLGGVLLLSGRHRACEVLSIEMFARHQQATAAETTVLRALCEGLRPREVAARSGVALTTVRTQIQSLRQKTGCSTVGDMVRRVTMLPPVVNLME